jgi:hypothetical protein
MQSQTNATTTVHPVDTGPGWLDGDGQPAQIVRCPDCGQMEWWTEEELRDHGKCRAQAAPCLVCEPVRHATEEGGE